MVRLDESRVVHCAGRTPPFWAAGLLDALEREKIGFFCSARCPGSVILKTFDAIAALRDQGQVLIVGFHSPMEWDCLGILLRGKQPVIWVPARSGMRLKPELEPAFHAGQLLILSPFAEKHGRVTAVLAEERNRFVADLSERVFVAHAAAGGRIAALAASLQTTGMPAPVSSAVNP